MAELVTPQNLHQTDFLQGALLLVNKPTGWTSFDVVNKIRGTIRHTRRLQKIKVGHAGTLDPMASGLLIICTGKWTTRLTELQLKDKVYTGAITLGGTTASYDKETPVENEKPFAHITKNQVETAAKDLTGSLLQYPPIFSAVKVEGKPLYKSARKGQEVEIQPRPVEVYVFQITSFQPPVAGFEISCGKGTYIRSLAHDLGQKLGCGAYLSELTRTRIGVYHLNDAWNLDELIFALKETAVS